MKKMRLNNLSKLDHETKRGALNQSFSQKKFFQIHFDSY
jgi:hypothetical protein